MVFNFASDWTTPLNRPLEPQGNEVEMNLLRVMNLTLAIGLSATAITSITACANSQPRTGPYETQINHIAGNSSGPGVIHVRRKNPGVAKSTAPNSKSNSSSAKSPKAKPVYKARVNLIGGNTSAGGVIVTREKPDAESDKNK
jgi:hypothetical protein